MEAGVESGAGPSWDVFSSEVERRADALLARMTLAEKLDYIGGYNDFYIRPIARLKVPSLAMSDGPVGVRNYGPATTLPAGISLAASWDTALARRYGEAMGEDARARGVHFLLGPGMNIYRSPLNGRNFEYFGEDPYLAAQVAVGDIEGVQSQGVAATAKHFAANNSEWDRHHLNSVVDERTLREIYLPAFEASVRQAHVAALMDSYNLVNGEHTTESRHLNVEIAKQEWGFRGLLMSDWVAVTDGVKAANSGLDLEMPFGQFMNREELLAAIAAGRLSEETVDDKVRRILRVAISFGWLDREQTDRGIALDNPKGHEVALATALGGSVLLKNEGGLLPLDRSKIKRLAVIGPNASTGAPTGGGSAGVRPFHNVTILEALQKAAGPETEVVYAQGFLPGSAFFDATEFRTEATGGAAGLWGEYCNHGSFTGEPTHRRVDEHVNFHFTDLEHFNEVLSPVLPMRDAQVAPGAFTGQFAARWSGYFTPRESVEHRFAVSCDGACKLSLDGKTLIERPSSYGNEIAEAFAALEAGKSYAVVLEYRQTAGGTDVAFGIAPRRTALFEAARSAAAAADAVILCAGFDAATESESWDRSYQLPVGQEELIREVCAVNPKTVAVLTAGGSVATEGWLGKLPALLHTWYAGQEAGTAVAQLLFGAVSPSGKLPITFERRLSDLASYDTYFDSDRDNSVAYTEGVFTGYRHFDREGVEPLYPFGFGLSYASFDYANLQVRALQGSRVEVAFEVTNTGTMPAAEIAQLYVTPAPAKVERPVRELKGFAKVDLKPGERRSVTLLLDERSFAYYDVEKQGWSVAAGKYGIQVGAHSRDIRLEGCVTLGL
jgi:beta-glucosidase